MLRKRLRLTMVLAAALALFTPVIASARDRDDYHHDRYDRRDHYARGYWGRDGCWHRY